MNLSVEPHLISYAPRIAHDAGHKAALCPVSTQTRKMNMGAFPVTISVNFSHKADQNQPISAFRISKEWPIVLSYDSGEVRRTA